jgi:hypothetical protein
MDDGPPVREFRRSASLSGPDRRHRLLARALQHETDHLDGRRYLDALTGDIRRPALRELRRIRPAVP